MACMVARARRPGLRDAHPDARRPADLRPGDRDRRRPASRTSPTATPPTRATSWARWSAPSSATGCSATSRRARTKGAARRRRRRPARRSSTRAGSCSRRSSPTSTNYMTIAREEIFGPVLIVIPFDDDDDAVRIANDNQYGLGGYVTSRLVRAGRGGRPSACGPASSASTAACRYGADAPFGGYKASGVGRQNGIEGFQQYTEVKTYAVGVPPPSNDPCASPSSGRARSARPCRNGCSRPVTTSPCTPAGPRCASTSPRRAPR